MRHGFAGTPSKDPKTERDRELTDEGVEMVKAVAAAWSDAHKGPMVVFCSPFTRTVQTADLVGKYFGVQVNVIGELAPQRPLEEGILSLLKHGEVKGVLLVGHVDNTTPAMNQFGGDVEWQPLVMAEVRRVEMDRKTGEWCLKWSIKPSYLGLVDHAD